MSELRIFYGPGYRVYFTKYSSVIVVLLIGGDKSSQDRDIEKAKVLARGTGLTREGLYKALSEEGNPTFATVTKIAKALGLKIRFESAA
jgi:transcriptional regulator with XRE-family HTH domain